MIRVRLLALAAGAALPLALASCTDAPAPVASARPLPAALADHGGQVVAMRRLTEAQYRNAIADIFGPDIKVGGRFEPIVRPAHQLLATGAAQATLSPAGLEQFDVMARSIAAQVFDGSHRPSFVPCAPANAAAPDAACARAALAPLGRYIFRRRLSAAELDTYVAISGKAAGVAKSFDKGLELAVAAMLVSPNFLYVIETAEPDPGVPGGLRLDGYSRAARLSFLLWNTTPNEVLLRAAESGTLADPAKMAATARTMASSPRIEGGVRAFFSDMLLFEKFEEIAKDPVVYPRFNQEVAIALPEQMLRTVVDHLLVQGGDYRDLFTTRRTYMTRALGPLYNVRVRQSKGWEPYTFAENDDRAGLLGQAGFLALYSHSGRSSPTLRGKAVREVLLCQPVPNPPGNVNFTAVQDTTNKAMPTARIRLSAHATDPSCSGCHKITDPIGLSLERFDGIGSFRRTENETPIDTSATFEGQSFSGALGLGKALAQSPATTECAAGRALEYATGQTTDARADTVEAVQKAFAAGGYRIVPLLLAVATMPDLYRIAGPGHVALAQAKGVQP